MTGLSLAILKRLCHCSPKLMLFSLAFRSMVRHVTAVTCQAMIAPGIRSRWRFYGHIIATYIAVYCGRSCCVRSVVITLDWLAGLESQGVMKIGTSGSPL